MIKGTHPLIVCTGIYRNPLAAMGHQDHRPAMIDRLRQEKDFHRKTDGIELGFRQPDEVFDFSLSQQNQRFVMKLRHNTAHFPYDHKVTDNEDTRVLFRELSKIYKSLGIHHTVFHPQHIEDMHFLWRMWKELENGKLSIESWIHTSEVSQQQFESLLINEEIGIVLDTCHAVISTWARLGFGFKYFMPKLEHRIRYIHFSGFKKPVDSNMLTGHHFVYDLPLAEKACLEPVWILLARNKNIGIVLEERAETMDHFPQDLVCEIDFIEGELD